MSLLQGRFVMMTCCLAMQIIAVTLAAGPGQLARRTPAATASRTQIDYVAKLNELVKRGADESWNAEIWLIRF